MTTISFHDSSSPGGQHKSWTYLFYVFVAPKTALLRIRRRTRKWQNVFLVCIMFPWTRLQGVSPFFRVYWDRENNFFFFLTTGMAKNYYFPSDW